MGTHTLALLHFVQSHNHTTTTQFHHTITTPPHHTTTRLEMSEKNIDNLFLDACLNGEETKVNGAIALGVDVNTKDTGGRTGLIWAISNEHENVVDILLAYPNIDINGKDNSGGFPLLFAADWGLTLVVTKLGRMPALRGFNDQGSSGKTPLSLATYYGHLSTVRELLKLPGINVNAADKDGRTPLHWAAEKGNFDVMAALTAVPGINLALKNEYGDTPLHVAAEKGNSDVMALLISAPGANLSLTNEDGKTAEQLARAGNHTSVLALIPGTTEHVQAEMSALRESMRNMQMGQQRGARIKVPECPVCFEDMAPPVQIFHCVNGHFVCGACKPNVRECPTCRNQMAGRAHGTEEMLKASLL